jgi:hypothetical protein
MAYLQTKFHSHSSNTSNLLFIVIKREAKYILRAVREFVLRHKKLTLKYCVFSGGLLAPVNSRVLT